MAGITESASLSAVGLQIGKVLIVLKPIPVFQDKWVICANHV
jgi:hypothetical protein